MGQIYKLLGLTVGCIQNSMDPATRRAQYACDITYGTNNEFGFDYLRDNMAVTPAHRVQRGFHYAIVDEVDSVLVDEARTPLIISGPVEHSTHAFDDLKGLVERVERAQQTLVGQLLTEGEAMLGDSQKEYEGALKLLQVRRGAPKHKRYMKLVAERPEVVKLVHRVEMEYLRDKRMHELDEDLYYAIDEKSHSVDLLEKGRDLMSPGDPEQFVVPDLSLQLAEVEGQEWTSAEAKAKALDDIYRAYAVKNERIHNVQALLKAYSLYDRDVEYVVQDGKVLIVDEFTGRLMPGRRYSEGLHQAIEAKEGVRVEGETQTLATITLQNFFRMYKKLAGMTGTAETESAEFWEIYKLDVNVVPTHKDVKRVDEDDMVFRTKREKYNAVIEEIVELNERGQPALVGTVSVEVSELLSRMLKRRGVKHSVLNAKYHQQEAEIVAQAGQRGSVTIATNMAGRGTDIKLGPGVADLGGLRIVGTERHESRRIDRQLRGRSGRQGDPGSSRFYLSLEDDLMRLFGTERISGLMTRMGVEEGEVIEHPLVTGAISRAQKRVEMHNFDIRKHLLEYDNVMNQQREVIYGMRNEALDAQDLSERVLELLEEAVQDRVSQRLGGPQAHVDEWDVKGLAEDLSYLLVAAIKPEELEAGRFEEMQEKASEIAQQAYRRREREMGAPVLREVERNLFLYTIDEHWRDHLYELDHLRGGIGLRAYGQRDPLVEYKREAYTLFEELDRTVREEFVKRLFRVQLMPEAMPAPRARAPLRMTATHAEVGAFSSTAPREEDGEAGPAPARAGGEPRPIAARSGARVGRNDPCPCGSGKKYKKCHMLIDEGVASGH
jgi:preprotein translocase subunit SecA